MTFNSLCLIINLLSQNKGEHYINVIKGNGIMIPFPESQKFIFTATKGFCFWILTDKIWVCDDLIIIFVHNFNDES